MVNPGGEISKPKGNLRGKIGGPEKNRKGFPAQTPVSLVSFPGVATLSVNERILVNTGFRVEILE